LGFKKGEGPTAQNTFNFVPLRLPVLRAAHVHVNQYARDCGITMIPNFRVPRTSIIYRVFHEQLGYAEQTENLNIWSSSNGTTLADRLVLIKAKQIGESVHALVIPTP